MIIYVCILKEMLWMGGERKEGNMSLELIIIFFSVQCKMSYRLWNFFLVFNARCDKFYVWIDRALWEHWCWGSKELAVKGKILSSCGCALELPHVNFERFSRNFPQFSLISPKNLSIPRENCPYSLNSLVIFTDKSRVCLSSPKQLPQKKSIFLIS